MKHLLLILLLFISFPVHAQVTSQQSYNNNGQSIIRFYNSSYKPRSCYYQDQYNYYTFAISPNGYSMWYPVFGRFQWQCR